MNNQKTSTITFRITPEFKKRVNAMAKKQGLVKTEVIRIALLDYLEKHEVKK